MVSSEQIGVSDGSDDGATEDVGSADGLANGTIVGSDDGPAYGTPDGSAYGTLDGTSLGDGVGTALEGFEDMTAVGIADGLLLSRSVGSLDGLLLSSSVGSLDGIPDGTLEGVVNGAIDGLADGATDGATDGSNDGSSVRQPYGSSKSLHFPQALQVLYANIGLLPFFTSTPICAQRSPVSFFKNGLQPFPVSPGTSLQ